MLHNHTHLSRHLHLLFHTFPPKIKLFSTKTTQPLHSLSSLLNFCKYPQLLRQAHARFILHGLHQNLTLSSKLIDCYANLGCTVLTQQVFSSLQNPSTTLYHRFLEKLYSLGEFEKIVLVYDEMFKKKIYPDEDSYPFVLGSCCQVLDVKNGRKIHGQVVKLGFESYNFLGTFLVDMYLDFWNSLISRSYQNGNVEECFGIFRRMRIEGVEFDSDTLINLLRSSIELNSLRVGKSVHGLLVVYNHCKNISVNTALLTVYSKLGSLGDARLLFDDMPERDCVVWNLMISANLKHGYFKESVDLLMQMGRSSVRPDLFTAIAVIPSISELKCLEWGKQFHAHVIRNCLDYQVSVHNCLIELYCKCDGLGAARKIFDSLTNKSLVTWSSMIKGYVNHDQSHDALSLFHEMKLDGHRLDPVTVIIVLPACVNLGALKQVSCLHSYCVKNDIDSVVSVNTAFLISYAKCGCIEMARKLFDEEEINKKDLFAWNAMISAYSRHGDWSKCFELYDQMKRSKQKPDEVTFLALLTACVNSGIVEEGRKCFMEMTDTYGCQPNQEHYACMVDLLGRAGRINEASELIKSMPCEPDARIWGPLLSACKMHSDTKLAELAAEKLIGMEPKNAGNYILLSNIYAAAGKWDGVAQMRSFLRDKGLRKTPGCSWLEINGQVHEFRVADQNHPKSAAMYAILSYLEWETKEALDMSLEGSVISL